MQVCLEKVSMTARKEQLVKSDFNKDNPYNETHPDALASSGRGKSTGHGGHTHSLPNCNGTIGMISYTNFDTALASGAGNADDNAARKTALARMLYSQDNPYSAEIIDTSANLAEGQYRVP